VISTVVLAPHVGQVFNQLTGLNPSAVLAIGYESRRSSDVLMRKIK